MQGSPWATLTCREYQRSKTRNRRIDVNNRRDVKNRGDAKNRGGVAKFKDQPTEVKCLEQMLRVLELPSKVTKFCHYSSKLRR